MQRADHICLSAPIAVRRAVLADAERLAEFAAHAFRATYGPGTPHDEGGGSRPEDVEAYVRGAFAPARQRTELDDGDTVTLLAEAGGAVAGYAQLRLAAAATAAAADDPPPPPEAGARPVEIARFYVDRAWQGRGVAGALFEAARAVAAEHGASALWLRALQRNARALAFYRRRGFRAVGTAVFRMGDERQDDWVMVRELGPDLAPDR